MKKLPIEISPNPLVSSVVELRIITELKTEELLGKLFPLFGNEFSNINYSNIPINLRKNEPQFTHNPDFIFSNDEYTISFGTNIISFENIGTYHLWNNYYTLIKDVLLKLNKINFIKGIERIGVRYISSFENQPNLTNILKINFELLDINLHLQNNYLQTELIKNDIKLTLRVAENGNISKGKKHYKGLFVDIDASKESNLPSPMDDELLSLINHLHKEEKLLFFSLLEDNFLATLKPIY